jgi:hypothetical protein
MGHSYNHGLVTSMKGAAIEAVRIVDLDEALGATIVEQSAAGFVASAVADTGIVTVQLAAPYPPRLVVCIPKMSTANATTDIITASYVEDSYDSEAGTFEVALMNDDDSGAPAAASPAATDELHILMVFCRYNGLSA